MSCHLCTGSCINFKQSLFLHLRDVSLRLKDLHEKLIYISLNVIFICFCQRLFPWTKLPRRSTPRRPQPMLVNLSANLSTWTSHVTGSMRYPFNLCPVMVVVGTWWYHRMSLWHCLSSTHCNITNKLPGAPSKYARSDICHASHLATHCAILRKGTGIQSMIMKGLKSCEIYAFLCLKWNFQCDLLCALRVTLSALKCSECPPRWGTSLPSTIRTEHHQSSTDALGWG